jgi:glycosyltransferase involved in cell wall biosynthesis
MPAGPIALCHEWTTTFGGAEQVSERIASLLGVEDVFTFTADPDLARRLFPRQRVFAHRTGRSTFAQRHWQWMLPVMPRAWKSLDLTGYRLVITNSHSCSNAIRVPADCYQVSYCNTPMRYAWDWRREIRRLPPVLRPLWPLAASALRRADRSWARSVTLYIANSRNVQRRIRRCYGRSSVVIHPAVDTSYWTPAQRTVKDDFFLVAGRLVAYKQIDVAVAAAKLAGVRLVVAGDGPELRTLKAMAGPETEFVIGPSRDELRELYRRARALLFPGIEDFGITPVEAQACGTPVIALDAGGVRETVEHGRTGVLYRDPSARGLASAVSTFAPERYALDALREQVATFAPAVFDAGIQQVVGAVTQVSKAVAGTDRFADDLDRAVWSRSGEAPRDAPSPIS